MTFLKPLRRVGGGRVMPTGVRFFAAATCARPRSRRTCTLASRPLAAAVRGVADQARGLSVVHETVHERRFGLHGRAPRDGRDDRGLHGVPGRPPMPLRYGDHPHSCLQGPTPLRGTSMRIRTCAPASRTARRVLASGVSVIDGAHYVERGYSDIPGRSRSWAGGSSSSSGAQPRRSSTAGATSGTRGRRPARRDEQPARRRSCRRVELCRPRYVVEQVDDPHLRIPASRRCVACRGHSQGAVRDFR